MPSPQSCASTALAGAEGPRQVANIPISNSRQRTRVEPSRPRQGLADNPIRPVAASRATRSGAKQRWSSTSATTDPSGTVPAGAHRARHHRMACGPQLPRADDATDGRGCRRRGPTACSSRQRRPQSGLHRRLVGSVRACPHPDPARYAEGSTPDAERSPMLAGDGDLVLM